MVGNKPSGYILGTRAFELPEQYENDPYDTHKMNEMNALSQFVK